MVRERYDAKSGLEFRPMYVAADTARDLVVVRWFARSGAPEEKRGIAGWEVLLLYTPRGRLAEAWVNEVPLDLPGPRLANESFAARAKGFLHPEIAPIRDRIP